jgi:hypothetical protein
MEMPTEVDETGGTGLSRSDSAREQPNQPLSGPDGKSSLLCVEPGAFVLGGRIQSGNTRDHALPIFRKTGLSRNAEAEAREFRSPVSATACVP